MTEVQEMPELSETTAQKVESFKEGSFFTEDHTDLDILHMQLGKEFNALSSMIYSDIGNSYGDTIIEREVTPALRNHLKWLSELGHEDLRNRGWEQ